MFYHLFFSPNTLFFYPQSAITLLNSLGDSSVVITLDKEYLLSKSPHTVFLERVQPDGTLLDNAVLIEHIRERAPRAVVLDNCFWDHTHRNSSLLENLLALQEENPFLLMNVLPSDLLSLSFKDCQSIVRRDKATHVYFPLCRINETSWTIRLSSTTRFYDSHELETDVCQSTMPTVEPILYKKAYQLFKGLQSIRLRNDLDLFTLFLDGLREKHPDEYLLKLVLAIHQHFFETSEKRSSVKNSVLSDVDMNNLFECLNRPVLSLLLHNHPLFDELMYFFAA